MKKRNLLLTASLLISASAFADNIIPDAPAWSTPTRGVSILDVFGPMVKRQCDDRIASYIVRPLHEFKLNIPNATQAAIMKPIVEITDEDMVDIAVYLSAISLKI